MNLVCGILHIRIRFAQLTLTKTSVFRKSSKVLGGLLAVWEIPVTTL
jgi:hypothetical protein